MDLVGRRNAPEGVTPHQLADQEQPTVLLDEGLLGIEQQSDAQRRRIDDDLEPGVQDGRLGRMGGVDHDVDVLAGQRQESLLVQVQHRWDVAAEQRAERVGIDEPNSNLHGFLSLVRAWPYSRAMISTDVEWRNNTINQQFYQLFAFRRLRSLPVSGSGDPSLTIYK